MYFINEKEAVKFLVDFVLPFLESEKFNFYEVDQDYHTTWEKVDFLADNCESVEDFKQKASKEFHKMVTKYMNKLSSAYPQKIQNYERLKSECIKYDNVTLIKSIQNIENDREKRSEIEDVFDYIRWLMRTPFDGDLIDRNRFEKIMLEYLNEPKKTTITWKRYGFTNIDLKTKQEVINEVDYIKKVVTYAVVKCLYSKINFNEIAKSAHKSYDEVVKAFDKPDKSINEIVDDLNFRFDSNHIILGEGFKYISQCQVCGKLFYKNRQDKVYCSKKCSSVGASRKTRSKK